ncbi:Gfo/Idh/MocA family protein [Aestuariivirga sp.]|uniref:Gfo/Idh/MocA family protein n=1 Tax=Aestuariivirga sp. TaxID=2650926 RepID=UPI003594521A
MTDTVASPIRVGLIGCGFYAQNHLNSWRDLASEGAQLVAVCDRDEAKARAAGEKFGAQWFTDATLMLDSVKLDLVDITTRMDTHRELAALTAAHKIPTVVQKPFAPEWDECVAIVENARKHGAWLAVHENFRFATAMMRVSQVIAAGTIGEPTWARINFRTGYDVYKGQPYFYNEERLAILDVGTHVLDLARVFLGEVERVSCETQRRNPKVRAEDTATMMLRHTSGAVSVIECTYAAKRSDDAFPETLLEIEGTEGSIIIKKGEVMAVTTQGLSFEERVGTPLLSWTTRPWHVSQEAARNTCKHMLDALRAGVPADTSGDDNLKTYALVEAAYESARTHAAVRPKA